MGEEQKEEKVYRIFERISDRYDRANNRISLYMHGRWKMELVKELTERCPLGESMLDSKKKERPFCYGSRLFTGYASGG